MKRLLRLPEVIAISGLSRSVIYRLEATGGFPKRVPLTEHCTAWNSEEVQTWVDQRIASRDAALQERRGVGRRLLGARLQAA